MSLIFNQQIWVVSPGRRTDPYASKPVFDWKNPTVVEVPFMVSVQPASTSEGDPSRGGVTARWRVITPPGTKLEVLPDDRIRVGPGLDFEVVGEAQQWPDPFHPGEIHHTELLLRHIYG